MKDAVLVDGGYIPVIILSCIIHQLLHCLLFDEQLIRQLLFIIIFLAESVSSWFHEIIAAIVCQPSDLEY